MEPRRRVAIVTCMDCRLDVRAAFGLELGDAHVIRNAGGIVTDDVIRSLAISQRRLGTEEVLVVHHTRCGMEGLDESALLAELEREGGEAPGFELGAFADVEDDVRESVRRLRESPYLASTDKVSGYLYDVDAHTVSEVT